MLDYKLCHFIYKCLHHGAPSYLSSVCIRVREIEGCRHLRSATCGDLVVLRTNNKTYGPRSFAVAGPSVWNSLPLAARDFDLTLPAFHKPTRGKNIFHIVATGDPDVVSDTIVKECGLVSDHLLFVTHRAGPSAFHTVTGVRWILRFSRTIFRDRYFSRLLH